MAVLTQVPKGVNCASWADCPAPGLGLRFLPINHHPLGRGAGTFPIPFVFICVCVLECVRVCGRVCVVWISFCKPLAFTFFLAYAGQTKCEILFSAKLSKGPWELAGGGCDICLGLEWPQENAGRAAVLRC